MIVVERGARGLKREQLLQNTRKYFYLVTFLVLILVIISEEYIHVKYHKICALNTDIVCHMIKKFDRGVKRGIIIGNSYFREAESHEERKGKCKVSAALGPWQVRARGLMAVQIGPAGRA